MQYCKKCNVHIRGNKECCPLCFGELSGTPEDSAFPVLEERKISRFSLWKSALFLFITFEIIMCALLYLTSYTWIPYAMLLGVFAILDVLLILYYRRSIIKLVTYEFYVCMALALGIAAFAGRIGIVTTWVLPFGFILLIPITLLINKLNHLYLIDYMIYLIFDVLMSLFQILFIFLHLNPFPLPAVISVTLMAIFASAIIIFRFDELRNAGSKYLHI